MVIKIDRIDRYTKKRDGTPYISQNGPFTRVVLNGGAYSTLDYDGWTAGWKIGDSIDVPAVQREFNGKTYWSIQKGGVRQKTEIDYLTDRVIKLEKAVQELKSIVPADNTGEEKVDPDDLPF